MQWKIKQNAVILGFYQSNKKVEIYELMKKMEHLYKSTNDSIFRYFHAIAR